MHYFCHKDPPLVLSIEKREKLWYYTILGHEHKNWRLTFESNVCYTTLTEAKAEGLRTLERIKRMLERTAYDLGPFRVHLDQNFNLSWIWSIEYKDIAHVLIKRSIRTYLDRYEAELDAATAAKDLRPLVDRLKGEIDA